MQPLLSPHGVVTSGMPSCLGTVKEGQLRGRELILGDLKTYTTGSEQPGTPAVLLVPDPSESGVPNIRRA